MKIHKQQYIAYKGSYRSHRCLSLEILFSVFLSVTSKFPEKLKEAQVVPCYKKSNALDKSKYRPASILINLFYYEVFFYILEHLLFYIRCVGNNF
jgi:hypothetical protein